MAQSILPQLASWPKMAALVRLEQMTDLARTLACSFVSAPHYLHLKQRGMIHPNMCTLLIAASVVTKLSMVHILG